MSESSSSSMENSENDWCVISKQYIKSELGENESKEKEINTESNVDKNTMTEDNSNSSCNILKDMDMRLKKENEGMLLETSETHSNSSSDVDIIEDIDNLNSLEDIQDLPILNSSLLLSMRPRTLDILSVEKSTETSSSTNPDMIDKEIQSSTSVNNDLSSLDETNPILDSNIEKDNQLSKAANTSKEDLIKELQLKPDSSLTYYRISPNVNPQHGFTLNLPFNWNISQDMWVPIVLVLSLVGLIITSSLFGYSSTSVLNDVETIHLEVNLKNIHNALIQCFGEQQMEGLRNNNFELMNADICIYNSDKYNEEIKGYLNAPVIKFLQAANGNPEDATSKFLTKRRIEINLPVIIRQLQHIKMLPIIKDKIEGDLIKTGDNEISPDIYEEMKDLIENLTLANRELRNQIAAINKKPEISASDDLIVVKDTKATHEEEILKNNNVIKELKVKITWLHLENQKLQEKIDELHELHKSQAYCFSSGDRVEENTQHEAYKKYTEGQEGEETAEKLKPYLNDLVSTLSHQILNLHSSLANELKEVKRYNELIRNMTMEIRNQSSTQTETDNSSWQQLRENIENIVLEAHQDLKAKISAFQTINLTDTFNNVIEDNKKNAEYMLNVINHYVGIVKEKTQEIIENPIPDIDKDSTVKKFWNVMDNIKGKWRYLKGTVKQMTKKFHSRKEHHSEKDAKQNHREPEGPSGHWYFEKSKKDVHNAYDGDYRKSDWLFKRAAQREKFHKRNMKDHKKYV